jgi:hypothetical protein
VASEKEKERASQIVRVNTDEEVKIANELEVKG